MDKKELGSLLRQYRKQCKLNATEVSKLLSDGYGIDIGHKSIYDYENGRSTPNGDMLLALCCIYGVQNPLAAFDVSSDFESELINSPLAPAAKIGKWMDESLIGDDFTEEEWKMLKRFAAFLIYSRSHE